MTDPSTWKDEARAMAEAVPYVRSQRMRRRLRERAEASRLRTRRHWSAMVAFAGGAAIVLLTVLVLRPAQLQIAMPSPPQAHAAGVADRSAPKPSAIPTWTAAAGCDDVALGAVAGREAIAIAGPCELAAAGVRVSVDDAATLRGDALGVELRDGAAEFDVDPAYARERPFEVRTPAVRIEVTGTRFRVEHDAESGSLQLHEGHVRIVPRHGEVRHVVAGERVQWQPDATSFRLVAPAAAETPSESGEPSESATPRPSTGHRGSARTADDLVRRVEALRSEGKFAEAAAALEAGLPTASRRDREVLSFELGKLLERSRGTTEACAHWQRYLTRFPSSRYADLVAEERTRLHCTDSP